MKYALIIPDGCADEPQESLGGKTPLQAANIPAMDAIAQAGVVGRSNNVPVHLTAGSAVANMNLLGYDVDQYFTGRAPLEAAAQGIELGPDDWAIRCNLVTVQDQIMKDFTADHIGSDEAKLLLADLQQALDDPRFELVPGVSYRNLLLYRGDGTAAPFAKDTYGTPPHDLTDKSIVDSYPRGAGSDLLLDIMGRSSDVFAGHATNAQRVAAGDLPATNVWLWGLGKTPSLPNFADQHGITGKMITAVDLLRGLAALIGWERIEVPGATGYTDTDYAAKGRWAIEALENTDLICVHVEATDEASHEGDVEAKVQGLEEIDRHIVAPLHEALRQRGDYRILVSPDHPTFLRTKTHSHGYVPWTFCGNEVEPDGSSSYDEPTSNASELSFDAGHQLMSHFLGKN
jgi:2,3-bisphosphoglycerate-independent phosphoglycerate mutase